MAEPAHSLVYPFADYVALEEYSNVRHDFRDGAILAMAGGSPEHAALTASLSVRRRRRSPPDVALDHRRDRRGSYRRHRRTGWLSDG